MTALETVGDVQRSRTEPPETWSEYSSASTTVQPLCADYPLCFPWQSPSLGISLTAGEVPELQDDSLRAKA